MPRARRGKPTGDREVRHVTGDDDGPSITIDIAGLDTTIEFVARLEQIKRAHERGEIETAEEYHRRVQKARTDWELNK